jgi:hypothetical protein
VNKITSAFQQRSISIVHRLENGFPQLVTWWLVGATIACAFRLADSSVFGLAAAQQLASALPYALVIAAPVVSAILALRWFEPSQVQPRVRLCRLGRWSLLSPEAARAHPLYGVTGFMASLLLGLLINIPVRSLEFIAAIPALGAAPPAWFGSLFTLMLADVVLLTSLYAVCFVAALRHVPLFPRLLVVAWTIDLLMQVLIAQVMGARADLPADVGLLLQDLLSNNIKKALISIALWAPYLVISRRVNITFRHRIPAPHSTS